jgi:hypothetical protein
MSLLPVSLGIIAGIVIAWILNKLLAAKVEDKNHRIGLKAAAYIVCVILGIAFAAIGSLRATMDNFIEGRIEFIEAELTELFPDSNLPGTGIDAGELSAAAGKLQRVMDAIDTRGDGFFESLIYTVFLKKYAGYVYAATNGITNLSMMGNENGLVTLRSVLYSLKDAAVKTITPYFIFGHIGILVLLLVYIGIYGGIVIFLKKGGALYNKSMVFGDIAYDADKEKTPNEPPRPEGRGIL